MLPPQPLSKQRSGAKAWRRWSTPAPLRLIINRLKGRNRHVKPAAGPTSSPLHFSLSASSTTTSVKTFLRCLTRVARYDTEDAAATSEIRPSSEQNFYLELIVQTKENTVKYCINQHPSGPFWHNKRHKCSSHNKELNSYNKKKNLWNFSFFFLLKQVKKMAYHSSSKDKPFLRVLRPYKQLTHTDSEEFEWV